MDINPGKAEALARAHEMRLMRDQGVPVGSIAALFEYSPFSVELILKWHEGLYPTGTEYKGECPAWDQFKTDYLANGRLFAPPAPRHELPEEPQEGNPLFDLRGLGDLLDSEDDEEDDED